MNQITAYITFGGNCREAMSFYKECFGGELYLQAVSETPVASESSAGDQDKIMHASLTKEGMSLMASDTIGDHAFVQGNNIALTLTCTSEEEIRDVFSKLSQGGTVGHALEVQFWGDLFGDLTDKFGIRWMLNFPMKKA